MKIAINTGGGDAPGLNAVIRAAVLSATGLGWTVYGIRRGYEGLFQEDGVFELTPDSVRGITHLGGTILGTTNRGNPLKWPRETKDGTMEFVDHRPLYDWILDQLDTPARPRQIEFAKLKVSHTIVGKRFLRELVESGKVTGWDDPRMPTISAMRRRGYPAQAIREFCDAVGVARRDKLIELANLEFHVRQVLNREAPRRMGVLRPLKVVIENYPEGQEEFLDAVNNPEDPAAGSRDVPFSRELYIEQEDFLEDPPKKFFRLAPGREVRLRYAYFVTCREVVKNDAGEVIELRCTYDPATRGGDSPDGRKVKGTLHWVSVGHSIPADVRLYETLIRDEEPDLKAEGGVVQLLNSESLETLADCRFEPSLAGGAAGDCFQLERLGYFCVDPDSRPGHLVVNRTTTLRDTWAKLAKKEPAAPKKKNPNKQKKKKRE